MAQVLLTAFLSAPQGVSAPPCAVCERLRRRNNAALLTSAVANKPLREEATFTYKDSSQ